MKNRLSKMSRKAYFMLLLLAACGVTSCKDEYVLDDEKPTWLNSSIYETLQSKGKYTYYLRLIEDDDVNPKGEDVRKLKDVLSKTGSKTVFVADDDAWKAFFAQNATLPESDPWHNATSYENLSVNQKKLLIHTSMLNNAIVMENLASSEGSTVLRGEYMRRYTDVEATDTITYVDGSSLPVNYNVSTRKDGTRGERDYWWRFRAENGGNGIHMVTDSSLSMMIHFTNEHMAKNNVTDEDFAIIMGRERTTEDVHIYDALLLEQDGVAENGYVNTTEKVLRPLPNMAELLRTNGETNIFSHMIDRWSVPFFNRTVTEAYQDVLKSRGIMKGDPQWVDSIFSKRYFSDNSYGHSPLTKDPDGQDLEDSRAKDIALRFDPGWSGYYGEESGPQYNMGAIWVPNDETLWKYFTEGGGGWNLIQTYHMKKGTANEIPYVAPTTLDELYHQIDQIPMSILRSLLNNVMCTSFVSYVPSKMTKWRDKESQEQLFYSEDRDHIQHCLLANNGVLYIMDKVYGPANYISVAAPAYTTNTNLVMNFAIYNGSTSATDYMGLNYYAYLTAMRSRFVLLLPSDNALQYYYDPTSFTTTKSRVVKFNYKGGTFPIACDLYAYNPTTGEIGKVFNMDKLEDRSDITNRLKDILESHTIVLTDGSEEINSGIDEYYLSKNGSPVKVTREGGHVVRVQGPFQVENEKNGIEGFISPDNGNVYSEVKGLQKNEVVEEQNMANGTTYILDSPLIPSARSVYNILTDNNQFDSPYYGKFYELTEVDEDAVKHCGLVDEQKLTKTQVQNELKKYRIFVDENGPDYNVQFFNNYNYTAFIPTNEAVEEAISKGLPTWDEISRDDSLMQANVMHELDSLRDVMKANDYNEANREADQLRVDQLVEVAHNDSLLLQAKITYLINFVRHHFIDNSVFADQSAFESTDYVTASYDNKKGLFCKVNIRRPGGGQLEVQDANTDASGNYTSPWLPVGGQVNIMARDITCNKRPSNTMNGVRIEGSSFIVIHQIPGVLNHTTLSADGRYDAAWASPADARKYVKRYAIRAK